jgi:hypothetical protein
MPTRRLASSLWVWYPIILSRRKSFHQRKEVKTRTKTGIRTRKYLNFILINNSKLAIQEKSNRDTQSGQKEV